MSNEKKLLLKWTTEVLGQQSSLTRKCRHSTSKQEYIANTFLFVLIVFATCISQSDACTCIYSHPQEHYCTADFVALVNVRRVAKSDPRIVSYHVKVKKEFRMTVKAREALSQGLIWTSGEESSCGRAFESNTRYLLTGRIVGDKPWISTCNYVERWSTLTYKQKKGFRRLYANGCRCKVREPPSPAYYSYKHMQTAADGQHRLAARPGYCHWETKWDNQYDCQALHSICTPVLSDQKKSNDLKSKRPKKKASIFLHECQWIQSQSYRQCMQKRKENTVDTESNFEEP